MNTIALFRRACSTCIYYTYTKRGCQGLDALQSNIVCIPQRSACAGLRSVPSMIRYIQSSHQCFGCIF